MKTIYKKFNNILIFLHIKKKVKRKYVKKDKIIKEIILEKPMILKKEKTQQEIVLQFLRLYNLLSKKKRKIYRVDIKNTHFAFNAHYEKYNIYSDKKEKFYFNIKDFLHNRDVNKCICKITNEEFNQYFIKQYKEIENRLNEQYNKQDFKDMQLYKKNIVFEKINYIEIQNSISKLKNIIEKFALYFKVDIELLYNNLVKDSMLKVQCSKKENLKLFFSDNNFILTIEGDYLIYKKDKCIININLCQKN